MPASIQIPTTFKAVDKFSSVVSKMTGGLKKFSKEGGSAVRRIDTRINNSIKSVGKVGALIGGLTIGGLLRKSFQDITRFETGLVGVAKTTGLSGKELKKLGNDVLTTSDKLDSVSSIKLLELAQSAGQLGVKGSSNILKFSTTLAKLEGASDIQGDQGASSIARLLTLTGEGVGVVDKFASSLVELGNNSAATESEILGVSSEVARATAAYKLNSKQILGISATLKSLDVRPEAAGTAVGKVFRGIEMATIKGGKTLQNFGKIMGLTPKQVNKTFKDSPQQAFDAFVKGLDKISKEGGSVAKALNDVGLSGETVSKGIIPLATNYKLLQEKMGLATTGFEKNVALNKEFTAASKTVQTALASISNGFSNFITKQATAGSGLATLQNILFFIGDSMGTIITTVATLIGAFVLWKTVIVALNVVTWAQSVALGAQAVANGVLTKAVVKNKVALTAYKVIQGVSTAVTWLATAATTAFGVALNLGLWPILAIIAAVTAVVLVVKNWGAVTNWFSKKWGIFTSFISEAWGSVVGFFKEFSFTGFFKDIGKAILSFMLTPLRMALLLLSKIPGKVGKFAGGALANIDAQLSTEKQLGGNGTEGLPSTTQAANTANINRTTQNNLSIDIKDKGNNISSVSQSGSVEMPVKITSTLGENI